MLTHYFEKIKTKGKKAYQYNQQISDTNSILLNPFVLLSKEWITWQEGYNEQRQNDLTVSD